MTLRQKYLKILAGMGPAGAVGISLLLGSTAPAAASQEPAAAQPRAADHERVSERLAAIRDAVSTVAGDAAKQDDNIRFAWWRNWGWGGWGRPWGGWGWPNWNNWRNWNNWNNWWRNW